ncbi:hypothetical protein BDV11DRAFT_105227 [Aspergillus similis]
MQYNSISLFLLLYSPFDTLCGLVLITENIVSYIYVLTFAKLLHTAIDSGTKRPGCFRGWIFETSRILDSLVSRDSHSCQDLRGPLTDNSEAFSPNSRAKSCEIQDADVAFQPGKDSISTSYDVRHYRVWERCLVEVLLGASTSFGFNSLNYYNTRCSISIDSDYDLHPQPSRGSSSHY